MPTIIPEPTTVDLARDAEKEYGHVWYEDANIFWSNQVNAWIRRAVAAEKENQRLDEKLDELYRSVLKMAESLKAIP